MSTNAPFLTKVFSRLHETKSLSHGYLLYGESRGARDDFARRLLNFLETSNWEAAGSPLIDSLFVPRDEAGTIGIEQVREAIRFLWQKPFTSPYRAVYLDGGAMTPEAQNALLKTAEEPPDSAILIVGAKDGGSLVPPLASRLQKLYVGGSDLENAAVDPAAEKLAKKFLGGNAIIRKEVIKSVVAIERPDALESFVAILLSECRKDGPKNVRLMSALLDRWTKISEFSTNKKLQLESLIVL